MARMKPWQCRNRRAGSARIGRRTPRSLRSTSAALHSGLGFGVAEAVGSLVGLIVDRPTLVTKGQLRGVETATPGVTRFEAFADEHVWVGRVENTPHQASDWHVHPGHDTYAHCTRGRFFVEFGRGGSERIEIAPGDFALIPKGVVHREGNAGADENDGIVVRVGQGPVTVNLDGPET